MRLTTYQLATILVILSELACCSRVEAQPSPRGSTETTSPPVAGKKSPGVEAFDKVMLDHMNRIGCTCATFAISARGVLIHSRGYGWVDEGKKIPTQPTTLIGIASCEKPVTAAAVRQLAKKRKLKLDDGVFQVLGVKSAGQVVDDRIHRITLNNLIDHKAGWEGDPIDRAFKAAREHEKTEKPSVEGVLSFLMIQKLSSDPGTKFEYCNFCFDTLRHVLEKTSKMSAIDYFKKDLFKPFGISEMKGFAAPDMPRKADDHSIVWNDRDGGPVSASAPALCRFMERYWIGGEVRDQSNPRCVKFGSLPASTAIMIWRSDGINVVAIFNGRNASDPAERITEALDLVIDHRN
jgi:CubicO group peptidase (beta-lactamase class C family)